MSSKSSVSRLPNALTIGRLLLTVVMLVLIGIGGRWAFYLAFALFLMAGLTDVLDGYFARRREALTDFGRLADPFVDKILICGGFTLLIGQVEEVTAWAVAIITTRELFVSALRSYVESQDRQFPANVWGKSKMLFQWLTLGFILLTLAGGWRHQALHYISLRMVYLTVFVTAMSGLASLYRARQLLLGMEGHGESS